MRDDELLDALADALAPPPTTPSAARIASLRRAVAEARGPGATTPPASPGTGRGRWPVLAAAAVAVVLALTGVVVAVTRDDGPAGVVEFAGPIAGDDAVGTLTVTKTGIGRVVELDTDDLRILPTGEFYELWFVGPDDRPGAPDRISAGTFHPDPEGRSLVTFAAAVDPAEYPVVEITAEPGDGDPAASLPAVVRADLSG